MCKCKHRYEDITKDKAASPTLIHEATINTGVIEAKQQRL